MRLMDFNVAGPEPIHAAEWAHLEPRLSQGDNHNFGMGCWLMQEHLRRQDEQEFVFLLKAFHFIRDEICD